MHTKWVFKHIHRRSGRRTLLLAALWCTGLLAGILMCSLFSYDADGILHRAIVAAPTPIGLFLVCVLPVAFIAIALSSSLYGLAYPTVVLSAVSRGFSGTVIYIAQGCAAWLLRPMLLFSTSCTSVLMWWLILQEGGKSRFRKNIRLAGILSCLIYVMDLFIVLPLVGDLTKYF